MPGNIFKDASKIFLKFYRSVSWQNIILSLNRSLSNCEGVLKVASSDCVRKSTRAYVTLSPWICFITRSLIFYRTRTDEKEWGLLDLPSNTIVPASVQTTNLSPARKKKCDLGSESKGLVLIIDATRLQPTQSQRTRQNNEELVVSAHNNNTLILPEIKFLKANVFAQTI